MNKDKYIYISIDILTVILLICVGILAYKLHQAEKYIKQVETETQAQMEEQSEKIVLVDSRVDLLTDSVDSDIKDLQQSIDKTKSIISTTNKALVRTQKQVEEKESEIQELREELKK